MDLTLHVMLDAQTHDISANGVIAVAQRYVNGDIIAVLPFDSTRQAPPVNGRLGYIHVTGIPDTITFEQARDVITNYTLADTILDSTDNNKRKPARLSKFNCRLDRLNNPETSELTTTKELTITFNRAKRLVNRKAIVDAYNATLDQEGADLSDGDFA